MGYWRFSIIRGHHWFNLRTVGTRWWITILFIEVHYSPKGNKYDSGINLFGRFCWFPDEEKEVE